MSALDAGALRAADPTGQLAEVLDLGDHLQDALWRVESAAIAPRESAGLVVAAHVLAKRGAAPELPAAAESDAGRVDDKEAAVREANASRMDERLLAREDALNVRATELTEREQALGVRLAPKVEVELNDIALRLVAAGLGDTYLPRAFTRVPYFPAGLHTVSFSPALYDTFAVVTRPAARLSPGVRELLDGLEAHLQAVAADSGQKPSRQVSL